MLSSTLTGVTVAVAELVMQWFVVPRGCFLNVGSNPIGHLWASRNGKQALPQPESPYVGIVLSANMLVFQTREVGAAPTIHLGRHKAGNVLIVNLSQ